MSFAEILPHLNEGRTCYRLGWGDSIIWVRQYSPYMDNQFAIRELPNSIGTWIPFLIKLSECHLSPWNPTSEDMRAFDWDIAGVGGPIPVEQDIKPTCNHEVYRKTGKLYVCTSDDPESGSYSGTLLSNWPERAWSMLVWSSAIPHITHAEATGGK